MTDETTRILRTYLTMPREVIEHIERQANTIERLHGIMRRITESGEEITIDGQHYIYIPRAVWMQSAEEASKP